MISQDTKSVLNQVAQAIYDKKGMNIIALDVRELSTLTDFFIIAEGNVDRHVCAIGRTICDELLKYGYKPMHIEGEQVGDWVVLDFGEFIVHLFVPELREKYALEQLWKEANIVDLKIDISQNLSPY